MTTQVTDLELDAAIHAALALIVAEQAAWFAACRVAQHVKSAQRKREADSRMQAIKAVGCYLDEFALHSGASGG